jgi:hypothetical protein
VLVSGTGEATSGGPAAALSPELEWKKEKVRSLAKRPIWAPGTNLAAPARGKSYSPPAAGTIWGAAHCVAGATWAWPSIMVFLPFDLPFRFFSFKHFCFPTF